MSRYVVQARSLHAHKAQLGPWYDLTRGHFLDRVASVARAHAAVMCGYQEARVLVEVEAFQAKTGRHVVEKEV